MPKNRGDSAKLDISYEVSSSGIGMHMIELSTKATPGEGTNDSEHCQDCWGILDYALKWQDME